MELQREGAAHSTEHSTAQHKRRVDEACMHRSLYERQSRVLLHLPRWQPRSHAAIQRLGRALLNRAGANALPSHAPRSFKLPVDTPRGTPACLL